GGSTQPAQAPAPLPPVRPGWTPVGRGGPVAPGSLVAVKSPAREPVRAVRHRGPLVRRAGPALPLRGSLAAGGSRNHCSLGRDVPRADCRQNSSLAVSG